MISLKRKAYIFLGASILILLAVLVFDFWILLPRLATRANEIVNLRREIRLIEVRTLKYRTLQKEVARAQAMRSLIAKSYPLLFATSPLDVFYFLEESAKQTGNTIDLDVREGAPAIFSITLRGSFTGLIAFLTRLEATPSKINLLRISASVLEEQKNPRLLLTLPRPNSVLTTTLEAIPFLPSLARSSP